MQQPEQAQQQEQEEAEQEQAGPWPVEKLMVSLGFGGHRL